MGLLGDKGRVSALVLMLGLAACTGKSEDGGREGRDQGPPQVGFVVVQPTTAPIVAELNGRTAAYESSDVRPQVTGLIRRRFFTEGAQVRAGQPLYEIDPSLYRAAVNQAQANLQNAQATAEAARVQERRFAPLARIQAVSQQELTNAIAQARQGRAQVAQNRAALETARINLRFTTVPAPISGRIGRSLFTVGALVQATQAEPLAQIQRLDPMFVDIQQSAADLLALRRQLSTGGAAPARAEVRLILPDGSDYPAVGTVQFSEAVVAADTGTVTLRARFPNPNGVLLPGMFVRARFVQAIAGDVFLVPQQAVSRDPKGNATLYVVGQGNTAIQRTVTAARTQGTYWVVTAGLKPGDRVITQGLGRLQQAATRRRGGGGGGGEEKSKEGAGRQRPGGGIPIRPVPANSPQRVQAPPAGERSGNGAGG